MRSRAFIEAVTGELIKRAIPYRVRSLSKHTVVEWDGKKRMRRVVIPASGSDTMRGPLNARANTRRILREEDAL